MVYKTKKKCCFINNFFLNFIVSHNRFALLCKKEKCCNYFVVDKIKVNTIYAYLLVYSEDKPYSNINI